MKKLAAVLLSTVIGLTACSPAGEHREHVALFVGIDVSGSFWHTGHFNDALDFVADYLHGHLNGTGGLAPLKTLFVGSIGGEVVDEPKSFHPIEDFQGKSAETIRARLHEWFKRADLNTDFNVFFRQIALIAGKRNLSLNPIEIVMVSDGIPDLPNEVPGRVQDVDFSPLEFLSRRVTVRLLYASPTKCSEWETKIPRRRVRMWTVDDQVMVGWKKQLKPNLPLEQQDDLWKWILDNVDYRVRPNLLRPQARRK
jgi:hypothetical protein